MSRKKEDPIQKMDFGRYYASQKELGLQGSGDNLKARCPFHPDAKASLSVDVSKGLWYCHAGCGGGDVVSFHARLRGVLMAEAREELEAFCGDRKVVPEDEIKRAHDALMGAPTMLAHLKKTRGIDEATARAFRLGWREQRWVIPIVERGYAFNAKLHDSTGGKLETKTLSWEAGMGEGRLFPYSNLAREGEVWLFEGELKAILAHQMGFLAISPTVGAGNWKPRFSELLKGRDVVLVYDTDQPGRAGATAAARALASSAKSVKIVDLPIPAGGGKDFPDWVLLHGGTAEELRGIAASSPAFQASATGKRHEDETVHETTLAEASDKALYYKRVGMGVTVSGKDLTPYFAPKKVAFSCSMSQGDKCAGCGLGAARGRAELDIPPAGQDVLAMIKCPDARVKGMLRDRMGIAQCPEWRAETLEVYNVEELRAIPEVTFSGPGNEYVSRVVYSVCGRPLTANRSYRVVGVTLPEPNTQYATQVIYEAEPTQTSLDLFKADDAAAELMAAFRPARGQTVREKVAEICRDLVYNVTRIYQREDLVQAVLTVLCSPLTFSFNGKPVHRGWMELLVVGDTRTGKTETVQSLMRHARLGEFVTGENASYAGLVGGLSQVQKAWHITWGKIPLNNRGLLAIDELSGLPVESIAAMSGIRSSGVAEIDKIMHEKTEARVRLVWMSNPRNGRKMDTFGYGVEAVRDLIGASEDVARFDLAVAASADEVSLDEINAKTHADVAHLHTSDALNKVALWAWSRKPEDVEFSPDAVDLTLKEAGRLGLKYTSTVPLVQPAEQRVKIARAAAATAALLFSSDRTHRKVEVGADHVAEAVRLMEACYDKPSMGYDLFSAARAKTSDIPKEKADRLKAQFVGLDNWQTLREALLASHKFRRMDVQDQVGYDNDEARVLFRWMGSNGLVQATPTGFQKTPSFNKILRELGQGAPPRAIPIRESDERENEI
jgi:hypothetical protein